MKDIEDDSGKIVGLQSEGTRTPDVPSINLLL